MLGLDLLEPQAEVGAEAGQRRALGLGHLGPLGHPGLEHGLGPVDGLS